MENYRQAEDLNLMNAHLAVENYRAQEALTFLAKIEPEQLEPELHAIFFSIKGQAQVILKDYKAGIADLRGAIKLFELDLLPATLQIERVRNWIGIAYYEQGKINLAIEEHRRCLNSILNETIEDARFCLKIYLNLGNDYLLLGQKDVALDFYRQALDRAKKGEDREDLAAIYWGMGLAYRNKKNLDRAKLYLGKCIEQFVELGNLTQACMARNLLGLVMTQRKEYDQAARTLQKALAAADTCPGRNYVLLASITTNLALLYMKQEDWPEAEKWGTASLSYAEKDADALQLSQSQAQLAEIKLGMGKEAEAIELFKLAAANIEQTSMAEIAGQIYHRYSFALRKMGRFQEAFDLINKACNLTLSRTDPSWFNRQDCQAMF